MYRAKHTNSKHYHLTLSTAPVEFTVVTKLVGLQKGLRIHQYLDDWLVQARSHQTCLQHTQTLVVPHRAVEPTVSTAAK